jgi:nickel-dependent lactate racemase
MESLATEDEYANLDPSQGTFKEVGHTSSGTPVSLREEFLECETRICIGMVTPHFASGFTGGPDCLLPGASSTETIAKNRSLMIRGLSTHADMGSNLVLADSMEACKLAGPTFNISFVPDGWGGVDSALAGELEATFKEATARYLKIHTARIDRKPDIVIVSAGALLGMDLYHGVRVLPNVWDIVRKDGTIILVAECSQGIGDSTFLNYTRKFEERRALLTELRHDFRLGAHVSLLLREALERNRVQLVSVLPDHYSRDSFKLKPSKTGSSAVQQAVRVEGKDAKILIVTRGDLTLPVMADNP